MDKYCAQNRAGVAKIILAITVFLFSANSGVVAQESTWSFKDNPHPLTRELTEEERFWPKLDYSEKTISTICANRLAASYQVYRNRYPEFGKTGDPEANYRSWKLHFATPVKGRLVSCVLSAPLGRLYELIDPATRSDFYFCGTYSRPPASQIEREIADTIDEMLSYAKVGLFSAAVELLILDMRKGVLDYNPDVEYYFRTVMIEANARDHRLTDIEHLLPQLSAERKAFVEKAAQRLDLRSVLDTTQPCPQR